MQSHIHAGQGFDINDLAVCLQVNLVTGTEFSFRVDAMLGNQIDILLGDVRGQAFSGGTQIAQAALSGFVFPFFGITITVEDDPLMLRKCGKPVSEALYRSPGRFPARLQIDPIPLP